MQFFQVLLLNQARRPIHGILCRLRLRKRNNLTYIIKSAQQRTNPIKPKRQSPMRWRSILQCLEEKTKLPLRTLWRITKSLKQSILYLMLVVSDRSAAKLNSIQHQIIRARNDPTGIFLKKINMFWFWARKRMMHGIPPFFFFIPLNKRKINNPNKLEIIFLNQAKIMPKFQPYLRKNLITFFWRISNK